MANGVCRDAYDELSILYWNHKPIIIIIIGWGLCVLACGRNDFSSPHVVHPTSFRVERFSEMQNE